MIQVERSNIDEGEMTMFLTDMPANALVNEMCSRSINMFQLVDMMERGEMHNKQ
jgi:hypothetical protein